MDQNRRWISVREAAVYLGVHEMTIRKWVDQGKLGAVRIGRCVRLDLRQLEDRLARQVVADTD